MEDTFTSTLEKQLTWPLRPIVTSLNGDQSWFLSFPRPSTDPGAKFYYHIVLEPWLNGPVNIFNDWIVHFYLNTPARVSDIEALNSLALQIESAAKDIAETHGVRRPTLSVDHEQEYNGMIDSILLFFHYEDHCHQPTLQLFDKRIPVTASPEAKKVLEKMRHFENISVIPYLDESAETWQSSEHHPASLPTWLTAVKCAGHHELNFVAALIWTHTTPSGNEVHESVLISPHGVKAVNESFEPVLHAKPETVKLAMLHGLKESRAVGYTNTFGAAAGLALYREMGGAKYWIPSHDSPLTYQGILMRLLMVTDTPRTLDWALEQEKIDKERYKERPNLVRVENGGCLVLA